MQFKCKHTVYLSKIFLFLAIQFHQTILIETIQFSISIQFSSIQPIDKALSSATTLEQSGPISNGNEEVLCIPQSSRIIGTSPSDCLVDIQDTRWWGEGVLPICIGAVSVFYSPGRLGKTDRYN